MKRISYFQNQPEFGNKSKNFKNIETKVSGLKTDLLVLPELFATGYAFSNKNETLDAAEDLNGLTVSFLKELSEEISGIVVGGWVEKHEGNLYNSSVMVYNNRVIANYRKIHLFNKENLWFKPGEQPFEVININGMALGMMICFDWYFPEACRSLALQGAEIIVHPCNLVLPFCQDAMITRCLENKVYAITANRIGSDTKHDETISFTGKSQIVNCFGERLAQSNSYEEDLQTITIDLSLAKNKSINPYNDLFNERKKDLYTL